MGSWPDVMTSPLLSTACAYGPMAAGARLVLMMLFMVSAPPFIFEIILSTLKIIVKLNSFILYIL